MPIVYALAALIMSLIINKTFKSIIGDKVVYTIAPIAEEILKTAPAYLISGINSLKTIVYIHVLFGIGEALLDIKKADEPGEWKAAPLSIVSHFIFGLITIWIWTLTDLWYGGIIASILIHCAYNYLIMRIVSGNEAPDI